MKRIISTSLAAAAVAAAVAQPQVQWIKSTVDFGAFDESAGPVTAVFRGVNTGDAPLVVSDARANCGCTTPSYDSAPVAPGDTLDVSVTYDPQGRPGRFKKYVYVYTNTSPEKNTLTVRGVVIGAPATVAARYPVAMGPLQMARSAALLGKIPKGHIKSVFQEGYNRSGRTLRPVVRDVPEWLEVTVPGDTVAPGDMVLFNFYVSPDRSPLYGLVTDTVTIVPDRESPEVSYPLPVAVTFEEDFSAMTPQQLAAAPVSRLDSSRADLGNAPAGPLTATFTLSNDGKSPLEIRRLYTAAPDVEVRCPATTVKPGKSVPVTVTVAPASPRPVNVRVTLITNDPAEPVRTLRLTAE